MPPTETRIRVKRHDAITRVEFIDRNILDEANIELIGEEIGRGLGRSKKAAGQAAAAAGLESLGD